MGSHLIDVRGSNRIILSISSNFVKLFKKVCLRGYSPRLALNRFCNYILKKSCYMPIN